MRIKENYKGLQYLIRSIFTDEMLELEKEYLVVCKQLRFNRDTEHFEAEVDLVKEEIPHTAILKCDVKKWIEHCKSFSPEELKIINGNFWELI